MAPKVKTQSRDELVEKLTDAFDQAHAKAKSLIDRQDDIVRALGGIQKLLVLGAGDAAQTAMAELLASDLKQSRERVYNRDFALRIAIKALAACGGRDLDLSQIKTLAPEAFEIAAPSPSVKS